MSAEVLPISSRQRARFAEAYAGSTLERRGLKVRLRAYDGRVVDVSQLEQRLTRFIELLPETTREMFGLTSDRLTSTVRAGATMSRVHRARLRFLVRINARIA